MAITFPSLALFRRPKNTKTALPEPSHERDWTHKKSALLEIGEQMLAQCRLDKQPLSVVVIDQKHLRELHNIFGAETAHQTVAQLIKTLEQIAAPKGLVIRMEVATFTVLLPGICRDAAQAAVEQALGKGYSVQYDAGHDEIVLAPDFLVQTMTGEPASIKEVCDVMRQDIMRLQQFEHRRKLSVRKEPQSQISEPTMLMEADGRYTAAFRPESTIPMPFRPR